jgi:hypothetical protein
MPYLKNNNAFFDISLRFLLLYWPGFTKATQLICLSFSNYSYKIEIKKIKDEIKNTCFVFFIAIFFIEAKKPGG